MTSGIFCAGCGIYINACEESFTVFMSDETPKEVCRPCRTNRPMII